MGVPEAIRWRPCNQEIDLDFARSGDWLSDTSHLVVKLLHAGVPVLAYSGDTDLMVDWIGTRIWMEHLNWRGRRQWSKMPFEHFLSKSKKAVGRFRSMAGLTFVQVYNAGHLVPADQPEAALELLRQFTAAKSRWRDIPPTFLAADAFMLPVASLLLVALAVLGVGYLHYARSGDQDSYLLLA